MADAAETTRTLSTFLKARLPLISIRSGERGRVLDILRAVTRDIGISAVVHTLSQGLRDLQDDRSLSEDRSLIGALDWASTQFQTRQNLTFVFTDVQDLGDDTATSRHFWDLAVLAGQRNGTVIVMTTDPVWVPLQRLGMSIALDPPNVDEMESILREVIEPYRGQLEIEWSAAEYSRAASILVGISRMEAENVAAMLLANGSIAKADVDGLVHVKDRIFSDISGIERVVLRDNEYQIGGLEGLNKWLEHKRPFLTADLRDRNLPPPRGVLLVGVPGCGKSLSAKAIAASWSLPLYRLDMASIFGQYVGQSESRLKLALQTADHVSPCVLWIDEIEKGLAGAGSDSTGITSRLVGQFLYWLQESDARVFVVATANDVSRLPPELLRRGRFDELFFVDLPTPDERRDIIKIYTDRYRLGSLDDALVDALVDLSEGFAGADLEAAMREAGYEAHRNGEDDVDKGFVTSCFTNIVALSKTNPEKIEEIRQWGRERAVPASGRSIETSATQPGRRVLA